MRAFIAALLLVPLAVHAASPLEELCGAHTRVVWVQDQGAGNDTFAQGDNLRLIGQDSRVPGERDLLGRVSSFTKPLITPDGRQVVFSDNKGHAHVVDWDGGNERRLAEGHAIEVWQDWVYLARGRDAGEGTYGQIVRCRIGDPDTEELVWDKARISPDSFQLSADGTRAGGLFPWPTSGIAQLPNKTWNQVGRGCWTSLAPDNSYMLWIFDGSHRNVRLSDPRGNAWTVDIHTAPGIDGFEVYHPRWSNTPRIMTMTGPYKVGQGSNKIRGGGKGVEIHVGRFDTTLHRIEKWVQVSSNSKADFYPDVWVEGGDAASTAVADTAPPAPKLGNARPGSHEGLAFVWNNSRNRNAVDERDCRIKARGQARFGRFHDMLFGGGSFVADDASARALLEGCRQNNEVTIEALYTPANTTQSGPARIVSFSRDPSARNLTLGQQKDTLVLRLRTPSTGVNGTNPEIALGKVQPGIPVHVIVSYRPGDLRCTINGQPQQAGNIQGDFSNWEPMTLLFGNEATGDRDAQGRLEGVAIYTRFMADAEAKAQYQLRAKELVARKPIPQWEVEARVLSVPKIPDPSALGTYRRLLSEYVYEEIGSGKRFIVQQWTILDLKPCPPPQKVGDKVSMRLEPVKAHPELAGERVDQDSDNFDLPVYVVADDGDVLRQ